MLTRDKHEIKLKERTILFVRCILNYFSFNKQAIVTYIHTCDVTTNCESESFNEVVSDDRVDETRGWELRHSKLASRERNTNSRSGFLELVSFHETKTTRLKIFLFLFWFGFFVFFFAIGLAFKHVHTVPVRGAPGHPGVAAVTEEDVLPVDAKHLAMLPPHVPCVQIAEYTRSGAIHDHYKKIFKKERFIPFLGKKNSHGAGVSLTVAPVHANTFTCCISLSPPFPDISLHARTRR